MSYRASLTVATLGVVSGLAISMRVHAGGDKVAFPENY